MRPFLCAALSILAVGTVLRADEIRLKDGSKIVGTVVGFEDGAFKVETAYGFAMVRKDSIAEIVPTAEAKPAATKGAGSKSADEGAPSPKPATSTNANPIAVPASEAKAQTAPGKLVETAEPRSQPGPVKPAAYVGAKTQPGTAPNVPPQAAAQPAAKQLNGQASVIVEAPVSALPAVTNGAPAPPSAPTPASPASSPVAPAPAAAPALPPAPAAPPEPTTVHEMVRGNLYINETYGFQMYRAPDWQPIVAARAALPNAIAALGTSDQSTMVIIGRDRAHDSLDAQSTATEKAVQEIYENYRPMPPQRITVAGSPAIERQFRGLAEKRDWAVTLVTLDRNGDVFTIFAMTDANSELVQFQANVISKAISSLQFTAPTADGPVPLPN
jgi:hypothetical protein